VIAALGQDINSPVWSPDGRWIAFVAGSRLRVIDARGARVDRIDQSSDLGRASGFAGSFVWSSNSDAIVLSEFDFQQRRAKGTWVSLTGERRPVPHFPPAPADLHLSADGRATWVEDNLLWRAGFDARTGLVGAPVSLGSEAAVEARHAADGSILYLSADGLRLRASNGGVRSIPWPLRYRAAAAPAPLLIRGARVIDGRGSPLSEPRDILVEGGRIARVAPLGTIQTTGVRIIDGTGKYLIPGLIDLHAHIWDDLSLLSWLHNGVTTIRDIASQRLKTPDTRNSIAAGIRPGPRVVYGGAMFHRGGVGYSTLTDQMTRDSASLARAVAIMAEMDANYLKERGFSEWLSAVQLVGEAHKYGLTVSGHCEHILPVVAAGVDGAEHILDCFRIGYTLRSDLAQLARAAGLWIVPTAALRFSMLRVMDDPSLLTASDVGPLLPPAFRSLYGTDSVARRSIPTLSASMKRLERSVHAYQQAGVTLATGTDSPFPLGTQHEMEVLVESGLTPMEAIVAATGAAARVLNAPRIGTIAEGQLADLVLLDANPLEDIRNTRTIREVIQGGRVVDRASLRQLAAMR
jgi:imidazolonepropionase-like amidohydrolase